MFGQVCVVLGVVVVVLGVVVVELPVVVVVEPPASASAAPAAAVRCLPVIAPPWLVTTAMEAPAAKTNVGGR